MDELGKLLEAARAHAAVGAVDDAVGAFCRAGAIDDAVAVLVAAERFGEAGKLALGSLGVDATNVGALQGPLRTRAVHAAACFARAGDVRTSTQLYLSLGDAKRAAAVLERAGHHLGAARLLLGAASMLPPAPVDDAAPVEAPKPALPSVLPAAHADALERELAHHVHAGDWRQAGRVAMSLARPLDAARHFERAGLAYEAANAFLRGGDAPGCLAALVRVPADHEHYRAACYVAIRIASELRVLDIQIEHFLSPFMGSAPSSDKELEAFCLLAELFAARDYPQSALELFERVEHARPGFSNARQRIDAMRNVLVGGTEDASSTLVDPPASGQSPSVPAPFAAISAAAAAAAALTSRPPPGPPRMIRVPAQAPVVVVDNRAVQPSGHIVPSTHSPSLGDPSKLEPGVVLNGRYRIEQRIGRGGMAVVYGAHDMELAEPIAVKIFLERLDEKLIARFKQELALSRRLAHTNIVRVFDIGSFDGYRFLTMERLEGSDLAARLRRGPLAIDVTLRYLGQTCQGLAVAHEAGVIHRDLKPANLFVTDDDVVKIMDFGIAKRDASSKLTAAGFFAGTPQYMAPEQINDFASATHLTDLYALGCIAYRMLTGVLPFDHAETAALLAKHLVEDPLPPSVHNPDIPLELDDLVLRLLAKEPGDRIQSARRLATELKDIGPTEPRRHSA